MKSERINLSLPVEIREAAQRLADERHYGTVSRLVAELIKREAERDAGRKHLEALLEEGHNSPLIKMDADTFFDDLRERARQASQ